ncbi:MAG: hypothetical protein AAF125_20695, partial [Chloroflexota bacterium]
MSENVQIAKKKQKNEPTPRYIVDVASEDTNKKTGRIARSTLIVVAAFGTAKVISLVQTFI